MEKKALLGIVLVIVVSLGLAAPTLVFATGFAGSSAVPDMAGPAILLAVGVLSLIGGVAGYAWRHKRREDNEVS